MGSSPYGTSPMSSFTPGCSPPVGSAPKSFPHFQHPSHALLEANGFKQQKYVSITCISSIASMAYHES
jgi:la-related protein 1